MSIDWQSTLAQLDAAPNIGTPAGQAALKGLLEAGHAYDSAGKPDVLQESSQHQQWASLRPSQRIGVTEPAFYVPEYYTVPGGRTTPSSELLTPDQLPPDSRAAYNYWNQIVNTAGMTPETVATGTTFLRNLLIRATADAREAGEASRRRGPSNGMIENALLVAIDAAHAFLAA